MKINSRPSLTSAPNQVRFTGPGSVTGPFGELRSGFGLLLKVYAGPGLFLVRFSKSWVRYWSVIPLKLRLLICPAQLSSNLNLVGFNTTINLPAFTPYDMIYKDQGVKMTDPKYLQKHQYGEVRYWSVIGLMRSGMSSSNSNQICSYSARV